MNTIYIYILFAIWLFISCYQIFKVYKKERVNEHLYGSIPHVFTTIGVLGTFIGIYIGLQDFNTSKITESIPPLLEGLKTAFLTSIIGIILSIIFGRLSEIALGVSEAEEAEQPKDEVTALHNILQTLQHLSERSEKQLDNIKKSIVREDDKNLSEQLIDIRADSLEQNKLLLEQRNLQKEQADALQQVSKVLGSKDDSSLVSRMKKARIQHQDNFNTLFANQEALKQTFSEEATEMKTSFANGQESLKKAVETNVGEINSTLLHNQQKLETAFSDFANLLAKNNTEALVEVMKAATEEFNAQMSELINKLVQENFSELNKSVKQLNDWQVENREMVQDLTRKYIETTEKFKSASGAIETFTIKTEEIISNTKTLTDDNGQLVELINTLKKVLIEDERFENSTNNLLGAITKIEENILAFDKTTHKLNDWIDKERGLKTRLDTLLVKLDEVADIKAYNGEFWDETKKQLNEGTSIITANTNKLNDGLTGISNEFQSQLRELLESMDQLIQRIIAKYELNAV